MTAVRIPLTRLAVRMDASNVHVVLTTIDASSGAMWAWKVDGGNGALDWERAPVPGTDSDQDAPRLKLPGPVIVQLDADAEPEVILTVPTDPNGRTSGSGARFVAMELTSRRRCFPSERQTGMLTLPRCRSTPMRTACTTDSVGSHGTRPPQRASIDKGWRVATTSPLTPQSRNGVERWSAGAGTTTTRSPCPTAVD